MIYRLILPDWATQKFPDRRKVREGAFTADQIAELNAQFYNVYYLPNYPKEPQPGVIVDGSHIDTFEYVFLDMDLKEGLYQSKDEFLEVLFTFPLVPTRVVDSGNGIHAFWRVSDLDAMGFLKLQRRVMRHFSTDEAVCKIYQLMRVPGTINTKDKDNFKLCETLLESDAAYTGEDLDKALPPLTPDDEEYCQGHFDKTYQVESEQRKVEDKIPLVFSQLLRTNKEVKEIWCGSPEDRSQADFRLGHIMWGNGFTKDQAMSVLINSSKALARAPRHRISYAENIVEKIWTHEQEAHNSELSLSSTVKDILSRPTNSGVGTRFPCYRYLDDTQHGFRLGQVIGLVAGSGVGKTAVALNMFLGFVEQNPDYVHFFVPLEQPAQEIAARWQSLCGDDARLFEKVEIISNYDQAGNFRHLSLDEIREYILKYQELTKKKIGAVVIDHVGALKKKGKNGENQDLMDICHAMKAFAIQTNTMLVMQSQAPREKAGIGDLELNKDAAYGTVYFESYCDYLITIWQPLKRCYSVEGCPTVTAFKFCKIRHKKQGLDKIQEDIPYMVMFDSNTGRMREMTQQEETSFNFFNGQATKKRKQDRKTDLITYTTIKFEGDDNGTAEHHKNT